MIDKTTGKRHVVGLTTTGVRVRKTTPEQRKDIRDRYRAGHQVKDIAADYSISPAAVSYHCNDIDRRPACGTNAGYQHHKARREDVCDACREARRQSERAYYLARKEGAA